MNGRGELPSFAAPGFPQGFWKSAPPGANGGSAREVVEMALDSLESGPKDIDPVVPTWYALSRMQREIVEHV